MVLAAAVILRACREETGRFYTRGYLSIEYDLMRMWFPGFRCVAGIMYFIT